MNPALLRPPQFDPKAWGSPAEKFGTVDLSQIEGLVLQSLELGRMKTETGRIVWPRVIAVNDRSGANEPLTTLRVIFEGGPRHGETRDIENRDVREITYGINRNPHLGIFDRYKRTIGIDIRTGRVIFRFAGSETHQFEKLSGIRTALRGLLVWGGLMKPQIILDI